MITLCIRYTLNANKLAEFEAYARSLQRPVERCGGKFVAFYLPTKIAGPTNAAFGLIDFPDLATYERYREQLASGPEQRREPAPRRGGGLHLERRPFVSPPDPGIRNDGIGRDGKLYKLPTLLVRPSAPPIRPR